MRLDVYLVENKLADSRTRAQEMIRSGQVFIIRYGARCAAFKPNEKVQMGDKVVTEQGFATEFVSRSGHKLKNACHRLSLTFKGLNCLDIGVSTGGFSEYLLSQDANSVVGVDVGIDQTHKKVRSHPRFMLFEKLNARYLDQHEAFKSIVPNGGFDFLCMDVSFISSLLVVPTALSYLRPLAKMLILVKPQFELGPQALDENGIVKDSQKYLELKITYIKQAEEMGLSIIDYFESEVVGKDGNQEFFLFAEKK